MSEEFSQRLSVPEMRQLMHRIGTRIAATHPIAACRTVSELQHAMNQRFAELGWGWTRIEETERALAVTHFCLPFSAALGPHAMAWTPALLEGAYQDWFKSLGAGGALRVTQRMGDAAGTKMTNGQKLEFRLSR